MHLIPTLLRGTQVPLGTQPPRQLGFELCRQHLIGRFIVHFYCHEVWLVIEVEGDQHTEPDRVASDTGRTAWLDT